MCPVQTSTFLADFSTPPVLIVTIAVGVQDRPSGAPQDIPWKSDYQLFKNPSFLDAVSAVSSIVFAYAGTSMFFSIAAEMREPQLYTRCLFCCQCIVTSTFLTIGVVVYYYCGSYVASPALGSAGPLMKKVSYGISIPGILASNVILSHVGPFSQCSISWNTNFAVLGPQQVYLRPTPPRHKTPLSQHPQALDDLASLHIRRSNNGIYNRQRDPSIQ